MLTDYEPVILLTQKQPHNQEGRVNPPHTTKRKKQSIWTAFRFVLSLLNRCHYVKSIVEYPIARSRFSNDKKSESSFEYAFQPILIKKFLKGVVFVVLQNLI